MVVNELNFLFQIRKKFQKKKIRILGIYQTKTLKKSDRNAKFLLKSFRYDKKRLLYENIVF